MLNYGSLTISLACSFMFENQFSEVVLAYAMVEIDKSTIFLDGGKLTPEASVVLDICRSRR